MFPENGHDCETKPKITVAEGTDRLAGLEKQLSGPFGKFLGT